MSVVRCEWCGAAIETRDPGMRFCSPEHKRHSRICNKKQGFLTQEAAAAMAVRLTVPGLRGVLKPYRCARAGDEHWHLYSDDKRKARDRAGRQAAGG
jgi:hypothetical protein